MARLTDQDWIDNPWAAEKKCDMSKESLDSSM